MDGKKITRRLIVCLLILISIAVIIIAFVGIYVKKSNRIQNILPDTTYSSEINGTIEYRLEVDTTEEEKDVYVDSQGTEYGYVDDGEDTEDEDWENHTGFSIETKTVKTNDDSVLTEENFEETKSIMEDRLDSLGATDYEIRLDTETGDMVLGFSQNDDVDTLYQTAILTTGEFRIIDCQTGVVLIDDSHISDISTYKYTSDGLSYDVYLVMEFDDEGTEMLTNISKNYIEYVDEDEETNIDYIEIQIDGSSIYKTYFGEEYTSNTVYIPLGSDLTDNNTINAYTELADIYSDIYKFGKLPVVYTSESSGGILIRTNINDTVLFILEIVLIAALAIILIVLTIIFGKNGFLGGIFNAAFIALLILLIKYLPIVMSVGALMSIVVLVIINVIFTINYLKALKDDNISTPYRDASLRFYGNIFHIIILAFIFTVFSPNIAIAGIGTVLFWGLIIEFVFNALVSRIAFNLIKRNNK